MLLRSAVLGRIAASQVPQVRSLGYEYDRDGFHFEGYSRPGRFRSSRSSENQAMNTVGRVSQTNVIGTPNHRRNTSRPANRKTVTGEDS